MFLTTLILLKCALTITTSINNDKRLLLTDPDVMQHRFEAIESKLEDFTRQLELEKQKVELLTTQLNHQASSITEGSATYVRWGKHSCNGNSSLVYSGQLGGTLHLTTGGASNPLCMVHEVLWGNRQSEGNMAEIHGAEYQDSFWGSGTRDKDVPCAVCKPKKRSTVLMMPGRNKCFTGWNEEYHGYLSANFKSHPHTSTYICVDENVEFLDAGLANDEGYLLYGVRAHCGSLKCPPYVNGSPITCVVCSQ